MLMMTKMLMISSMRLHVFIDFGVSHEEGLEATHDIVLRLGLSVMFVCSVDFALYVSVGLFLMCFPVSVFALFHNPHFVE